MQELGALVLVVGPSVPTANSGSALPLVQGMRSTDTQEKEVKNGRLAMVSCLPVLAMLISLL